MKIAWQFFSNMSFDRMSLDWNYQDRVVGIRKGTNSAAYSYDYRNIRKAKTVTDSSGFIRNSTFGYPDPENPDQLKNDMTAYPIRYWFKE